MARKHDTEQEAPRKETTIGVTQIALGIGAILIAGFATELTVLMVGVVLVARGGLDLLGALREKGTKPPGRITVAVLSLALGVVVLVWPRLGASLLGFALAGLFIVGGGEKLLEPLMDKHTTPQSQLVIGAISLLLGILILVAGPVTSFAVLGILVGVEILLNGMTAVIVGNAVRSLGRGPRPQP
jgi:uncharacterized membrane protein HdeD (DUF308 family)